MFTRFIESKQYRQQVHKLLQGEVFDRENVPVLKAMRDYIDAVEANEKHVLHGSRDDDIPTT